MRSHLSSQFLPCHRHPGKPAGNGLSLVDQIDVDQGADATAPTFVQDVRTNPDSAAVTDAIIALAKSLRLSITAEGVETQKQMAYLRKRSCQEGQGFYFSRPVPASAINKLLQRTAEPAMALAV